MSTQKGNCTRTRPQKYKNQTVFKNDLHDKTKKTKFINSLDVANVCERCKKIIEWKVKYKKYKPLKALAKCTKCEQKCIRHAYHIMCLPCAKQSAVCPKCGEKVAVVEAKPSKEESIKLDAELQALLKQLPERKRRTFIRYMNRKSGNKKSNSETTKDVKNDTDEEIEEGDKDKDENESIEESLTRDDLLLKLKSLVIEEGNDNNFDSDTDDDSDSFM